MEYKKLSLGPLGTNCYLLYKEDVALIIDPGAEADRVIHTLTQIEKTPKAILLTHAHFDHIGAVDQIRAHYDIPVYLHKSEEGWLADPALNSSKFFPVEDIIMHEADFDLNEGPMSIATFDFLVLHTPGHSPGGVSFVFDEDQVVVSGDCLFKNGMGRFDLPEGDKDILLHSIREVLLKLPDHYLVLPGHGEMTRIGNEKKMNPFI